MTEVIWGLNGVNGREVRGTKTPRSLSYTGCWTCRKRRVKCDERPFACRICEEAKLTCAGYDVRLIWNPGQNDGRSQKQRASRRQIKPDRNTCRLMTDDEVMRSISKIDQSETKPDTTTCGPFSVFGINYSPHSDSAASDTHTEATKARESLPIQEASNRDELGNQQQNDSLDYMGGSQSTISDEVFELPDTPLGAGFDGVSDSPDSLRDPTGNHISYPEQDSMEISTQAVTGSSDKIPFCDNGLDDEGMGVVEFLSLASSQPQTVVQIQPDEDRTTRQTPGPSNQLTHRSGMPLSGNESSSLSGELMKFNYTLTAALGGNSTAAMLIHHYTKHMVHLMQPIFHQGNPFRTIYLPLAIEGSPDLKVSRSSDRICSPGVTVFHSLLSTAATHLLSLRSGEDGLQQLACHHKQRALVALRSALTTQSSNYKDLMTAILSLVSADIIDGGTHDHWIHLEAAIRLQASRHYGSLVSRETRQLNIICRMLHLFAQTALPQPEPKPWPGVDHVPTGADFDYSEPSIEFIYGITTSIAGAILKIYRLTQYLAFYEDQVYPQSLMQACETLGDELCSWTIYSEPFSAIDPNQGHMLKIARAQARAFHSAAMIYYYRSIQKCARECLRLEQRNAITAMNEAEDLKDSFCKDTSSFPAPITWPAFIASCEAIDEDRQDWDKWWSRVQRYQMGNYSRQQSIVHGVWAQLDNSEVSMDWREALSAMNLRIIPV